MRNTLEFLLKTPRPWDPGRLPHGRKARGDQALVQSVFLRWLVTIIFILAFTVSCGNKPQPSSDPCPLHTGKRLYKEQMCQSSCSNGDEKCESSDGCCICLGQASHWRCAYPPLNSSQCPTEMPIDRSKCPANSLRCSYCINGNPVILICDQWGWAEEPTCEPL
jgi:hypothetical protein